MLRIVSFALNGKSYICQNVCLSYYGPCNAVLEHGHTVFIDYASESLSETVTKFLRIMEHHGTTHK